MTEPEKVPRKRLACRWCGKPSRYGDFCSRLCTHEFYGTTESDRDE